MKAWYVLRAKPKRDTSAAAMLQRANIEVYLPQVALQKGPGQPPAPTPLFPSYFFSRLDPTRGEIHLARYTYGVASVIGYGEEPIPVPDDLILAIKERAEQLQGRKTLEDFQHGDRVAITRGPLREVEAIFDSHLSGAGRVRVLIRMLQRYCPTEVPVGQLRLLGKAARPALT